MSHEIPFSGAGAGLPQAPPGTRLARIRFKTCPGSDLVLQVVHDVDGTLDSFGVPRDAWWRVRCKGLPDRTMRLHRGTHALRELLKRYGFQDARGCIHHRDAVAEYDPSGRALKAPAALRAVPSHLQNALGVPQFYPESGVCWYASLCWSSFANPQVRDFLTSFMPRDMANLCQTCLGDRDKAEALRKRLWYDLAVGDNVEDPPRLDGRNGFTEFSVLCAKLGVPMLRFREEGGTLVPLSPELEDRKGRFVTLKGPKNLHDPHLLVLRYNDGDHHKKHPIVRRILHRGHRYRLVGSYMGSRKCGHQIGTCCPTGHWRDWSITDADLHKDGIGPIFLRFEGDEWKDRWWDGWRELVHVTKFGRNHETFCSLSPHNERDDLLDEDPGATGAKRKPHRAGKNSIDVLYFSR